MAYISAIHAAAGDVEARATVVTDRPPEKLIKIGAKVVSHGRYVTFLVAEIGVPRQMFREILSLIARIRAAPAPVWWTPKLGQKLGRFKRESRRLSFPGYAARSLLLEAITFLL
jgi:hypothetical protein